MIKQVIKLDDIAKKLNVSKVTVSKALRNHPDISNDMTEKIKKTAAKMGYYPNRFASTLSSKKSKTIGIVVPKIAHYFFSSIIESIYDSVFDRNYEAILMVSQENPIREKKHLESLISLQVDGILVSLSKSTEDYSIFETIKKLKIPLVFFDRILDNPAFSSVTVNDQKGSFELIDLAIRSGYTKIAHFAGPLNKNIGHDRFKGYAEALEANGLAVNKKWLIEGGYSEKDGYDGFMKLYKQKNLPELIYTVTFPVALGVINAARETGVQIPKNLNLLCFGRSDYNHIISPNISCVVQPTDKIGKKSVELLLSEIENPNETEKQKVILDTRLEIYDSFFRQRYTGKNYFDK